MTHSNRIVHVPTIEQLRKKHGGRDLATLLMERECSDVLRWKDDFLGDEISGSGASPGMYEVVTGVDGSLAIVADQAGGVAKLEASSGAGASGEYCGLSLPELAFTGDYSCCFMSRLYIDNIGSVKFEFGFTDVTTDAGVVDDLAAGTATASNAAVWVMDRNDNTYLQCFGVKDTAVATKIEPGDARVTPVNATFFYPIVALEGNTARFYLLNSDGRLTYSSAYMADAIEGGTKVCPWIFVQLRGAVDRHIYIDMIDVWGRRVS